MIELKLEGKVLRAVERRALESAHPNVYNKRRNMILMAARDGKCCVYCQRPVKFVWEPGVKSSSHNAATFEHYHTLKKKGGTRTLENGKIACYTCNNYRGDSSIEDFMERLASFDNDPLKMKAAAKIVKREKKDIRYQHLCLRNTLRTLKGMDHLALLDAFVHRLAVRLTSWSHCVMMAA